MKKRERESERRIGDKGREGEIIFINESKNWFSARSISYYSDSLFYPGSFRENSEFGRPRHLNKRILNLNTVCSYDNLMNLVMLMMKKFYKKTQEFFAGERSRREFFLLQIIRESTRNPFVLRISYIVV